MNDDPLIVRLRDVLKEFEARYALMDGPPDENDPTGVSMSDLALLKKKLRAAREARDLIAAARPFTEGIDKFENTFQWDNAQRKVRRLRARIDKLNGRQQTSRNRSRPKSHAGAD